MWVLWCYGLFVLMVTRDAMPERFGEFVLLKKLGAGGMGTAYLAVHPPTEALLVIKRMHPQLLENKVLFRRFVHEAEVATHLRHENVAALVAMGTVGREPFLATEYVFGLPWRQIVRRVEESIIDPVPLDLALYMATQMLAGVVGIHEAKHRDTQEPLHLIHRDIGARNVLVGFSGRIRIIDFGLGKSQLSTWHTAYREVAGSPDYMAPEQALGDPVDARADVYAAAVTIWELIAGRKRLKGSSVAERLKAAVVATPEDLRPYRPEVSSRLEAVLKHAMEPKATHRTASASILLKTLEEERQSLDKCATRADMRSWLDSACATVMAKERRELEEVRAAWSPSRRAEVSSTTYLVGMPEGFEPPSVATSSPARVMLDAGRQIRPRAFALAALVGGLVGVLVMILTWPQATVVEAEALPVVGAPEPYRVPPPTRAAAVPVPDRTASAPDQAHTVAATSEPPQGRPSAAVRRRKKVLVESIRALRTARYDIAWQKKLTRLSVRLSRAETIEGLRPIEAVLRRMRAETP